MRLHPEIEVIGNRIVQIVGKRNRAPTKSEMNIIKEWIKSKRYDMDELCNIH